MLPSYIPGMPYEQSGQLLFLTPIANMKFDSRYQLLQMKKKKTKHVSCEFDKLIFARTFSELCKI